MYIGLPTYLLQPNLTPTEMSLSLSLPTPGGFLAKLTKFKSKKRNCTGDGWGDHSIKLLRKAQLVDFLLQQDPALGTDQHVEEVMAQPFASAKEELLGTYGALPARAWYRDENGVLPDAYKSGQEGLIESTEQRVQRKRRKREADKRRERGLAEKLLKGTALPSHAKLPQPEETG